MFLRNVGFHHTIRHYIVGDVNDLARKPDGYDLAILQSVTVIILMYRMLRCLILALCIFTSYQKSSSARYASVGIITFISGERNPLESSAVNSILSFYQVQLS
jgi:hypothetical protein